MASVDSVSNSNTGAYTIGGAALGAIGGGAYGYFSKPWLKDGAPNDAFYRTVAEKALEATEEGKAEKTGIILNEALVNAKNADELAKAQADYALKLVEIGAKDADEATRAEGLSIFKSSLKDLVEDSTLPNKTELLKQLDEAKSFNDCKPISIAINKATIEATEGGFEAAKTTATKALEGQITSLTEKGKKVAEGAWDASKKEFKLDGLADEVKKPINEAMSSMKTKAALKWAGIAAATLGVIGFIVAKCTGKSEPATGIDTQA